MAEHDPADVEFMARLICTALNYNPQKYDDLMKIAAIRALDRMQARGEKVTTWFEYGVNTKQSEIWKPLHDAAPMTPR